MLAGCLEGGQAVKQAGSHWKQSPLEVQLGKYLQLQIQIVPAHPEIKVGIFVIKSKSFLSMKEIKYAKKWKRIYDMEDIAKNIPVIGKLLVSRPVEKFQWTSIYF